MAYTFDCLGVRQIAQSARPFSPAMNAKGHREDFPFDKERNVYICPAGKVLTTTGKLASDGETLYYRPRTRDCRGCPLKSQCCPKAP